MNYIYDKSHKHSSNFIRICSVIYLITILIVIVIIKVFKGECDISNTGECKNGGALMYTLVFLMLAFSPLIIVSYFGLKLGEAFGKL
jgi:hypothetical protein